MAMKYLPLLALALWAVPSIQTHAAPAAPAIDAAQPSGALPDQLALEIARQPTNDDNCAVRFHVMMQLVQLVHASLGQSKLEQALPFQRTQQIRRQLDAQEQDEDRVYRMLDESLLKLCQTGRESPLIQRLRRVVFPSPTGQQVVAYLVSPSAPSDRAFVFGHGGFGHKEMWLDLMLAVADQTGAYALTMDFEGTGESSGYCTWSGRIGDFSGAMDYLQKEWRVTRFAVGGHSGGGAWPAACAAIRDPRISAVVLWDCIFDFYDTHVGPGAPEPGGNPAALLDHMSLQNRGKRLAPTEVAEFRQVEKHLDAIYDDIEKTMGQYRNTAELLGQAQQQRRLAVLHIVAEDVTRSIGQPQALQFAVNRTETASPIRRRFLNRPLRFTVSGLFGRRYKAWEAQLGQPSRTVLIPNTTHGFERPGRDLGLRRTVEWLNEHFPGKPASAPRLSWTETGASLALLHEGRVVWQFNHLRDGSERGCPYFHPLATLDGAVLTDLRPDDHLWHRGLRFAWKKINGLEGYWTWPEGLDRWPDDTGQTEVTAARVIAGEDFSARFELELSYHPPGRAADLTEKRTIRVSAPDRHGSYRIDWHGVFTAGERGAVLDRTPIPGEPDGKRWGGYAGLQLRLPPRAELSRWALLNSENVGVANGIEATGGLETVHGRKARWMQVTLDFVDGNTASVALFDHPGNLRHPVVWHASSMPNELIQTPLFHGPHTLPAGESLTLHYRIVVRPGQAETAPLEDEWRQFSQGGNP